MYRERERDHVCVYIYIYTHIHTQNLSLSLYAHIHVYIYIYIYTYFGNYVYIYNIMFTLVSPEERVVRRGERTGTRALLEQNTAKPNNIYLYRLWLINGHLLEPRLSNPVCQPMSSSYDSVARVLHLDGHRHLPSIGWHYLSSATCLIRPHLLYVLFVVSRFIITRYTVRRF